MLIQLDIENVAVIERASIEFNKGLNVITGETGAGKSLLINSLNMVLGGRSSRDLIREGCDFCKVCAIFSAKEADGVLNSAGISTDDGNVIITRKLFRDGRNICHINGDAVNVATLHSVGEKLVVIHGQHDSSTLMDTSMHIRFLDSFAKNKEILQCYKDSFYLLKETRAKLEKLNEDSVSRQNEIDYLTYQITEIENASLSPDEEEQLTARKAVLENSEAISSYAKKALSMLNASSGARESLYDAKRSLEKLSAIDASAEGYCEKISDLYYEAEELARDLSAYTNNVEYNPAELESINDRLNLLNNLKRKYNCDIPKILDFYKSASERLSFLLSFDENKEALENSEKQLFLKTQELAQKLTATRLQSAKLLSQRLCSELENLDMPKCVINFNITSAPFNENGAETVELVISTNPSEAPKSLCKIASGGEISRVMLAIKSVFSDFDKIPTLLFDEIDTGVSGRAAEKIGNKMKALSQNYQIICVTHLPVIACCAGHHLLIEKSLHNDGFKTQIKVLSQEERINEIARIISGDSINEISLENAKQMLLHSTQSI